MKIGKLGPDPVRKTRENVKELSEEERERWDDELEKSYRPVQKWDAKKLIGEDDQSSCRKVWDPTTNIKFTCNEQQNQIM